MGGKRISDTEFKQKLLSELKKEDSKAHSKTNFYELLRTKYSIHKQRALELHSKYYSEWANLRESGLSKGIERNAIKEAESGLKSKLEKQLHIQKQIDEIQNDIDRGVLEDYVVVGGKLQVVNKIMNAETKAYLRKTIKELYAELNKMDGSYAPTKIAGTDTNGNDIAPQPTAVIQFEGKKIEIM
jgi:hypothetical protein